MNVIQFNDYWIATDVYLSQDKRNDNAKLVYNHLHNTLNWTPQAVAGIIGNMDVESTVNPALIQGRNIHTLIDNYSCLSISSSTGVGLVQWTGDTSTPPVGQKLASFAIRYGMDWYNGELQCFRLQREYEENIQFDPGTVDGVYWDWESYITSKESPSILAKVWQYLYERGGTDTETRQRKALYYYRILTRMPLIIYANTYNKRKVVKARCQGI